MRMCIFYRLRLTGTYFILLCLFKQLIMYFNQKWFGFHHFLSFDVSKIVNYACTTGHPKLWYAGIISIIVMDFIMEFSVFYGNAHNEQSGLSRYILQTAILFLFHWDSVFGTLQVGRRKVICYFFFVFRL